LTALLFAPGNSASHDRFDAVPRYYFHLFNDLTVHDEEGVELPNDDVAMRRAADSARYMAAESVREGHVVLDHRIEVTNEHGRTVGVVHFSDVVAIKKSAASG
jgi:hypothetical protein